MLNAKQVADLFTLSRLALATAIIWIGVVEGRASLPLAVYLVLIGWMTDFFDGRLARRSRVFYSTWVGDHDLEADILLAGSVFIYMLAVGQIDSWFGLIAVVVTVVAFVHWGVLRVLGMLVQALTYGWFILVALRDAPEAGRWLLVYCVIFALLAWQRLREEQIPAFFSGLQQLLATRKDPPN